MAFASALVHGEFAEAYRLLTPELRVQLSPSGLQDEYYGMFCDYTDGEPHSLHFEDENFTDEWPAKEPGDVGWAYISLLGDGCVEAVTVIVAEAGGALLIRNVDWGRP